MAIIKRKRGNTIYIFEATYKCVENGKQKYSWKLLGKLDENGNLIPTKKKAHETPPQEEVKALAIPDNSSDLEIQEKPPEAAEEVKAELVRDKIVTKPDKYMAGTSKPESIVFDANKNEGLYISEGAINVSKNEIKRKDINVMISLDFNELKKEGVSIAYEYRLTPFDRAVHNVIATLWEIGHRDKKRDNEYLTPRIIFQVLSGNTEEDKSISSVMRKDILASIDKMGATKITIDNSAEAKAFGYKKFKYFGSLLYIKRIEGVKINGNEVVDCIQVIQSPALYEYAKRKKQIISVDIKMLNIPRFSNTSENIELKEYLLRRIMAIKNPKSRINETIKYQTIYEYLRIEANTRATLLVKYKRIRSKVKKILEFWKSEKFIVDYKEEKEGKLITKITITC